mmetsp:Transcript_13788/g.18410  ORF Transcript_13788/g.18410 Transcript_13788/m.18410 type:complete len:267 (-) Transcript_13788:251-1051(-)
MLQEETESSTPPEVGETTVGDEKNKKEETSEETGPKDEAAKYEAAGEGVVSHKGETKKVFFLQQRKSADGGPQWLKSVTTAAGTAMTSATAAAGTAMSAAGDTMQRFTTKKSDEKKEIENMETEDKTKKERLKAFVDASRASVETASTRLSGLMASMKSPESTTGESKEDSTENDSTKDKSTEPPPTSRLTALRSAMATLGQWKERTDEVAELKKQISNLNLLVASLSDRIVTLEKHNNIEPPPLPATINPNEQDPSTASAEEEEE